MPTLATDTAIDRLAKSILDTSLPKDDWTHEAHFAFVLWCIRHRPELTEPDAIRDIITSLNDAHGTPNTAKSGYHHTITLASIRAARSSQRGAGRHDLLNEVLANLMTGPFGQSDWILRYWSKDVLFSAEARRTWLPPDKAPLEL